MLGVRRMNGIQNFTQEDAQDDSGAINPDGRMSIIGGLMYPRGIKTAFSLLHVDHGPSKTPSVDYVYIPWDKESGLDYLYINIASSLAFFLSGEEQPR